MRYSSIACKVVLVCALGVGGSGCGPAVRVAGSLGNEDTDLVAAYISLREWPGGRLEVEPVDILELREVSFFEAWPARDADAPKGDAPHYRCAVYRDDVWCTSEQILAGVSGVYGLGAKTGKLSDDEWVYLCTWATGVDRLGTRDPAEWDDPRFAGRAAAARAGQMTERHPGGGITVTVFYEFTIEPKGGAERVLRRRVAVSVMSDNTVQVTHENLWPSMD